MIPAASIRQFVAAKARSGVARKLTFSMIAAIAARLGLLVLAVVLGRQFGPTDYGAFTSPPAWRCSRRKSRCSAGRC